MGGFFGAISSQDVCLDVFFGVDYHSHLGTRRGGMVVYDKELGFQKQIHNIENSPFRTKFERDIGEFKGCAAIGCISDSDPQPLLIRSHLGLYAISTVGRIRNAESLIETHFSASGQQFLAMSSGKVNDSELIAALINEKETFTEGILYAQDMIEGSASILILTKDSLIVARDKMGRLPIAIGSREDGYCVSMEPFAYLKTGYSDAYQLGPREILKLTPHGYEVLSPAGKDMKICGFLWAYYGYPNSNYEGVNVELMRYRNGAIMAKEDKRRNLAQDVDYVAGVPDSGLPHAIGYANETKATFARPFIKYTPTWSRSFMSANQSVRSKVAKMKQIPVTELIDGKKLLFVDDSVVRGTQLQETVDFLYANGAKEVHMRSACPPVLYECKYLSFSPSKSEKELLARKIVAQLEGQAGEQHLDEYANGDTPRGKCMLEAICERYGFTTMGYQSIDGFLEAIGIDREKVCTYCWTGKE